MVLDIVSLYHSVSNIVTNGNLMLVCSIGAMLLTHIIDIKLKSHEFKNTTDGGVVRFKSFMGSYTHGILKNQMTNAKVLTVFWVIWALFAKFFLK